jgi:hypothetical protein
LFFLKVETEETGIALVLIEDLGFLPLVREIQRLSTLSLRSTREKTEFLTLVEEIPDLQ